MRDWGTWSPEWRPQKPTPPAATQQSIQREWWVCPRAKNSSLISKVLFPSGPVRSIRQVIVISQAHRDLESSPVDLTVKNLPVVQETRVQYLGWKDTLEKEVVIHCSIPAWRIPWTEEPDGLQSIGRKDLDTTERLTLWLSSDLEGLLHLSWSLKNYRQLYGHTKFTAFLSQVLSPGDQGRKSAFQTSPGPSTCLKWSESESRSVMSDSLRPHGFLHCRWILYQLNHKGSPRTLEWVAYPFSSRSSQPRNQTKVFCIAGRWILYQLSYDPPAYPAGFCIILKPHHCK